MDCRQANANEICGVGGACANTCRGATLSCPGVAGKPNCGSWDFESGTEGWTVQRNFTSDSAGAVAVSSTIAHSGTHSLSLGHNGEGFSNVIVQLCPSSVQTNVSQYKVYADMYIDPSSSGADALMNNFNTELYVWVHTGSPPHTSDAPSGMYLDLTNGSGDIPVRSWRTVVSTGTLPATTSALELQFRTYNTSWSGTVYWDNVRLSP